MVLCVYKLSQLCYWDRRSIDMSIPCPQQHLQSLRIVVREKLVAQFTSTLMRYSFPLPNVTAATTAADIPALTILLQFFVSKKLS